MGFLINLKKSVLHPVKQIEFLGFRNRYRENYFCSFREKMKTYVSTMSEGFQATKNFSLKSHKVNWPVVIDCQAILPAGIQFRYLQQEKILALQKERSCDTGEFSKAGTPLVEGKLETLQWGKKFSSKNPIWSFRQMPQQMAGGIVQESFDRGRWSKEEKHFHINVLELLTLNLQY